MIKLTEDGATTYVNIDHIVVFNDRKEGDWGRGADVWVRARPTPQDTSDWKIRADESAKTIAGRIAAARAARR